MHENLKLLAKDLTKDLPRSPRETLGGYAIAGRTLEGYIPKFLRKNRPVYVWFDVYDIEEQRI